MQYKSKLEQCLSQEGLRRSKDLLWNVDPDYHHLALVVLKQILMSHFKYQRYLQPKSLMVLWATAAASMNPTHCVL